MSGTRPDGLTFVLDSDLNPLGVQAPCPSHVTAVLGLEKPTEVWCGLLEGHEGNHVFHVEWVDQ